MGTSKRVGCQEADKSAFKIGYLRLLSDHNVQNLDTFPPKLSLLLYACFFDFSRSHHTFPCSVKYCISSC